MGYYTNYELTILEGDDCITDYKKEISDISGYNYCFEDSIKWYDFDIDMKKLSLKHPNTVFKLNGNGEENGDIWVSYYKNGKSHYNKAVIVLDEYNENNLV